MNFPKIDRASAPRSWWLYGALFFLGAQAVSVGLSALAARTRRHSPVQPEARREPGVAADAKLKVSPARAAAFGEFFYYESLIQPRFAPPAPVFPVVWTMNNALTIWGLLHVLKMPKGKAGRREFLAYQGVAWACYVTFGALFFGLRSTLLGVVNTITMLGATAATVNVALAKLRDKKAALSQVTLLPWLLLAGPTATLIALWNRDPFFKRGPFAQPALRWAKKTPALPGGR